MACKRLRRSPWMFNVGEKNVSSTVKYSRKVNSSKASEIFVCHLILKTTKIIFMIWKAKNKRWIILNITKKKSRTNTFNYVQVLLNYSPIQLFFCWSLVAYEIFIINLKYIRYGSFPEFFFNHLFTNSFSLIIYDHNQFFI